ncbi:MAG: FHA domain-containing protein [Lentisphaeria bacterium]|nr:FHA domain-containing protein [Lentisphaeria bacterium]
MGSKELNIHLEVNGRPVQTVHSGDITGELTIGRSHSCDWVIPKEDSVVSSKHASLIPKKGRIWIYDNGSKNGIYVAGRRVEKKLLEPGDKVTIGSCSVTVDEAGKGMVEKKPSSILVTHGNLKGRRLELSAPESVIGSSTDADLPLMDMLVSRRHAVITKKEDDSCWIMDPGSKNGLKVNDVPLPAEKERLLKDEDRISIAQFELVFHDGAVPHNNYQVVLRLGIIGVTLLLTLFAYWGYQHLRPSAGLLVSQARRAAAREDFRKADELLDSAEVARGADKNKLERADLERKLTIWRNTIKLWDDARAALTREDWIAASRALGGLQAERENVWTWNKSALEEKEKAMLAKRILDSYHRGTEVMEQEDSGLDDIRDIAASLTRVLADTPSPAPPYFDKLLVRMRGMRDELNEAIKRNVALDETIHAITLQSPPFETMIKALKEQAGGERGQLRKRAEMTLQPVMSLANSFQKLNDMSEHLRQVRFDDALSVDIALPSPESCAVDPRLSQKRQDFADIHTSIQKAARHVAYLYGQLDPEISVKGNIPPCLTVFGDPAAMERVLACDIMEGKLPKRGRESPQGVYDQLVGNEELYEFLRVLPEELDREMLGTTIETRLSQAERALKTCASFITYMNDPERLWLGHGPLGTVVENCRKTLAARDALVSAIVKQTGQLTGRRFLISGGIALRLADKPEELICGEEKLQNKVIAEFRKLRLDLAALNAEYGRSAPERQIEIREEIMSRGLPGDAMVRRMWAGRDAANAH